MAIVTTSWDDGHPLDLRLAEKLCRYGMKGTFYVPIRNAKRVVMSPEEIRTLRGMGIEIGAHTVSHRALPGLPKVEIEKELLHSKSYLEDVLGEEVVSFCYPKGRFNRHVRNLVEAAGYRLARTTVPFRTTIEDPFLMPVSFQIYPHSRFVSFRRAVKERNWRGLGCWLIYWRAESDLAGLTEKALEYLVQHDGVLHLWGHSWEIEKENLWDILDDCLRLISQFHEFHVATNAQVLHYLR